MEQPIKGEDYVHINEDGTYRELTESEAHYLSQSFHFLDSGRPYIKSHYEERTPDNKIYGFLPRTLLPPKCKQG